MYVREAAATLAKPYDTPFSWNWYVAGAVSVKCLLIIIL